MRRLARASARRKWAVIGAWAVAVLASSAAIASLLGSALTTDDDFTGRPEAQRAALITDRAFPEAGSHRFEVDEAVIVSSPRSSADDPAFERRLDTLAAELRTAGAREVRSGPVSEDGHGLGGADEANGSGLRGLSDRIDALGGTFRVESPARRGTVVRAEIPCA